MWSGEGHRLLIRIRFKLWEKEDPKARAQISISLFNRFSFIKVTPCNSQKHFLQSCNRYTITFNAKITFILANACFWVRNWSSYAWLTNIDLPQHFKEPSAMMAIWSPSSSTSSIECVVSNIILPFFIFLLTARPNALNMDPFH